YTQEMVDRAVGESIRLEELESYLLNQRALLAHKEAEVLNLKQANAKLTKKLNRTIGRRLRRLWRKMLGKKDRKKLSLADDGQESTANASPAAPTLTKGMFRQQAQQDLNRFLDGHFSIRLPIAIQPKISIILILYNQAELTYKCLDSIANQLDVSFEVIIIDNASSDRTQDLMAKVSGATIVYNKDNVGFLRAVNQACKLAKGEQILLLNNDTVIGDKAFGSASQLLDSDDSIGAVGAKLILPDGTLQEAGSLLWNDGSALGYARGENPDHYSAQFQRDVDYCSGAFLLTRTKLWQELGGFDERYAPAYYEETDFCLRLWEQGYRIVYNPHSVIYHFEFGSSKTSDEAIALQTRNRSIFLERHKDYLGTTALAPHEDNIIKARSRQNDAKKILLIDDRLP
ncbi:MAG: glycosyltransferase family 2 protein, partial [Cohaesibacter sp.]|nr:glycosyltransferase family 2 protein [Cohaesibacter sp.]